MSHIKISLKHREGQKLDNMDGFQKGATCRKKGGIRGSACNYSYRHLQPIACQLCVNKLSQVLMIYEINHI